MYYIYIYIYMYTVWVPIVPYNAINFTVIHTKTAR